MLTSALETGKKAFIRTGRLSAKIAGANRTARSSGEAISNRSQELAAGIRRDFQITAFARSAASCA